MDLANFEMEAGTSNPLAGAVVQAVVASLTHPNAGTVVASTSTDLNGYWTLTGLSDANIYDIQVTSGGRSKWYKAYTRHNISHMYDDTTPDANRNLLQNGGQDSFVEFGAGVLTLPAADPGIPNTADGWTTYLGSGDSGNAQRTTATVAPNSQASTQVVYTRSGGQATHYRNIPAPFWQMLKGKTITASFQVFQLTASSELRAFISDGVGTTFGTVTSTVGSWQTVTVTRAIDAAATKIQIGVQTNRADTGAKTFYVDNGIADLGSIAPVFSPDVNDALILPVIARATIVEAAPSVDSNTLAVLLNNLAERSKSIIGAAAGNWKSAVPATLTSLLAAVNSKVNRSGDSMTGSLTIAGELYVSNDGGDPVITMRLDGNANVLSVVAEPSPSTGAGLTLRTGVAGGFSIDRVLIAANGAVTIPISLDAILLKQNGNQVVDVASLPTLTAGNASALGTVAPTGYARRNAGSYVGNNTGQSITVGFQARFVVITSNEPATYILVGISTAGNKVASGVFSAQSGVHIDSGNTFSVGATSEANDSTKTYQWAAYS